jgi:hypothetical protein
MGEWLDWSTAWKAVVASVSAIGTLKSWRNHWKGPRSLARFFHREMQLVLMTQDRDYYKATCDELIEKINAMYSLSDASTSSHGSADPKVMPIQELHPRDLSITPSTNPRSRKPSRRSIKPPSS